MVGCVPARPDNQIGRQASIDKSCESKAKIHDVTAKMFHSDCILYQISICLHIQF